MTARQSQPSLLRCLGVTGPIYKGPHDPSRQGGWGWEGAGVNVPQEMARAGGGDNATQLADRPASSHQSLPSSCPVLHPHLPPGPVCCPCPPRPSRRRAERGAGRGRNACLKHGDAKLCPQMQVVKRDKGGEREGDKEGRRGRKSERWLWRISRWLPVRRSASGDPIRMSFWCARQTIKFVFLCVSTL